MLVGKAEGVNRKSWGHMGLHQEMESPASGGRVGGGAAGR